MPQPVAVPRSTHVIAVTSGKGGVGKTSLSVNLALAFAAAGRRVLLIDADLGLANADILLDEAPRATLRDVLRGECPLEEALTPTASGVTLLAGASGTPDVTRLSPGAQRGLLDAFEGLDGVFDTVLIDTAAGIGADAMFFASLAATVLLVTTPEPTALTDAYATTKVLATRYGVGRVGLVLNQARDRAEAADVFGRLGALTTRFLPVVLDLVGVVPRDPRVHEAIMAQQPLLERAPNSPAALAVKRLARALTMSASPAVDGRLQLFWRGLVGGAGAAPTASVPLA